MPVHIRTEGDVVVLSNFGRLMNDPRHFDASQEVSEMLGQGYRKFVMELRGVGEMGASGIGLLITISRLVRQHAGEIVLVSPSRGMQKTLEELQMEEYWEVFDRLDAALRFFQKNPGGPAAS